MSKIYEQSEDQHVRATIIYKKQGDIYAYSDSLTTTKIGVAELGDMFKKGVIIIDGGVEYRPVSFAAADGMALLTYVKTDNVDLTKAVLATLAAETSLPAQ